MIKPLQLGIEGHFLNLIKGIYKTLIANTLNDEGLNAFPLKSRIGQGCPLLSLLLNTILKVLASAMRQGKEIKGIQIAKEEVKLFVCDITMYIEYPRESNKKLLQLINDFSKVAEYKINL